jgi:hypothetical protein
MAAFEGSMSASSLAVGALEAVHAGREMEAVSSTPICYPIVTCRAQFERRTSEIDLRLLESGGADGDRLDLLSPQRVHKAATILGSGQHKRSGAQEQKQQPDFRISEGPRNRQEDLRYRDRNKRTRRPYTQWDDGTRSKRSVIDKSQLELHPSRSLDSPKVAEISWLKWRRIADKQRPPVHETRSNGWPCEKHIQFKEKTQRRLTRYFDFIEPS